ncbi:hypothetical protein CASFOL_020417 [Castilleja foliolosa]|uniref:Ribosomal protein L1 n=1 Tax=Castilleja foliolosa TaxID=1961234 RepID=A0ABD3D0S6_9LAMI
MAASYKDKIEEKKVLKSVKALLKWKKNKSNSQPIHELSSDDDEDEHHQHDGDDFIYLSVTLIKPPPKTLTLSPHRIPLRHSLHPIDLSAINSCLIVDGKKITAESSNKILASKGIPFIKRVFKLPKLKSDYKSFESKQKLYDSFDLFFADRNTIPLLPSVLGKVFYRKKKKIPVPLDLKPDGSNWKEEIENAFNSSLLCLSGGTCSAVRVGKWGVNESDEIVENVCDAIDGVLGIVGKKWGGIRCFHLKFSDSLALPIYEKRVVV